MLWRRFFNDLTLLVLASLGPLHAVALSFQISKDSGLYPELGFPAMATFWASVAAFVAIFILSVRLLVRTVREVRGGVRPATRPNGA